MHRYCMLLSKSQWKSELKLGSELTAFREAVSSTQMQCFYKAIPLFPRVLQNFPNILDFLFNLSSLNT